MRASDPARLRRTAEPGSQDRVHRRDRCCRCARRRRPSPARDYQVAVHFPDPDASVQADLAPGLVPAADPGLDPGPGPAAGLGPDPDPADLVGPADLADPADLV